MPEKVDLKNAAKLARKSLLEIVHVAKAAHVGSSLSAIEIFLASMTAFESKALVIVSKGHAAAGYYSCLFALGKMTKDVLYTYGENGSILFGHVSKESGHEIPFSTGSLGHGLPYGVGRALGRTRQGKDSQVIVVCSDGELNEGTTWESALLAAHHKLGNLTMIVDRNGIQSIGRTEDTLALEPLFEKWDSFGWEVIEVDGHDSGLILKAIESSPQSKPRVIIARTVKGKGVSFMENNNLWHYRPPNQEQLAEALQDVESN
jgi:transketolase